MYPHQINEMVEAVQARFGFSRNDGILTGIREALISYWGDKIALTWTADDVVDYAEDLSFLVTKEQAIDILQQVLHEADATTGTTWYSFDKHLIGFPEIPEQEGEDDNDEE